MAGSEKNKKTFEQKLEELKILSEKISNPETGLEDAISYYEKGMKLGLELQNSLQEHIRRIEKVTTPPEPETEVETEDFIYDE